MVSLLMISFEGKIAVSYLILPASVITHLQLLGIQLFSLEHQHHTGKGSTLHLFGTSARRHALGQFFQKQGPPTP